MNMDIFIIHQMNVFIAITYINNINNKKELIFGTKLTS
jgi:hypothetical protein